MLLIQTAATLTLCLTQYIPHFLVTLAMYRCPLATNARNMADCNTSVGLNTPPLALDDDDGVVVTPLRRALSIKLSAMQTIVTPRYCNTWTSLTRP